VTEALHFEVAHTNKIRMQDTTTKQVKKTGWFHFDSYRPVDMK